MLQWKQRQAFSETVLALRRRLWWIGICWCLAAGTNRRGSGTAKPQKHFVYCKHLMDGRRRKWRYAFRLHKKTQEDTESKLSLHMNPPFLMLRRGKVEKTRQSRRQMGCTADAHLTLVQAHESVHVQLMEGWLCLRGTCRRIQHETTRRRAVYSTQNIWKLSYRCPSRVAL